ncbi:MAG: hypothetical protein WCT23_06695 [Candidatus Neomarinimicrobiota bacterium]
MNKKIYILLLAVLIFSGAYAGVYEIYGLGEVGINYSVDAQGRGKSSTAYSDSLGINMQNPANLAFLQKAGMEIGIESQFNSLKGIGYTDGYTGFKYGLLKFPLTKKGGIALGLLPITSSHASYRISSDDNIASETRTSDGNIYAASMSVGYSFFKYSQLAIGVSVDYLIGGYNIVKDLDFVSPSYQDIKIESDEGFNGWQFTGGITIKPIKQLSIGASYTHVGKMSRRKITNYMTSSSTYFYSSIDTSEYSNVKLLPNRFSLGLAFMPSSRYIFTADWMQYQFSALSTDFSFSPLYERAQVRPFNHYGIGFEKKGILSEYVPYHQSLTYRGGLFYEQHYLATSQGKALKTYGATLGMGFPFTKYNNRLDIAFIVEHNQGTIYEEEGITPLTLNEFVYRFNMSITIAETWFITRGKYR